MLLLNYSLETFPYYEICGKYVIIGVELIFCSVEARGLLLARKECLFAETSQ
jgi:hypothetical protein